MDIVTLQVTCANTSEASKISTALLVAQLAACVKQLPISSSYWWEGKIEHSNEILLVIETRQGLFAQIEQVIRKLHSYDTFTLIEYPANQASAGVAEWIKENTNANRD